MNSILFRINQFCDNQDITITELERKISASKGVLSRALAKNTDIQSKWITEIVDNYQLINPEWLLTGKGEMLKSDNIAHHSTNPTEKGYPLVSIKAIGGFSNGDFSIEERDVMDYYVVPKFRHKKIDFMIEVEGSSMYPKYNSGDVVACTIINEQSFIQWNKVHVIATKEQGILIKRIKESEREGCYKLISDNKDYPPFDVPKDEVIDIALVAGVIRLE